MKTDGTPGIESRIIEAAKQVFVRKGYEATTMGDIAAEVGISRTAMHYYFRTKEMMFDAIFAQLMELILPNINLVMNEESSILEKLPKVIDAYLTALLRNPLFPLFVVSEMNRDMSHLFNAVIKNHGQIQPMIRLRDQMLEEMEKGLLNKLPLEDIASTFIGLIVFPLLIRQALVTVFMNGDPEAFEAFIARRKQLVYDIMIHLLSPLNKES
jgi:AcrR family transcriptional regulator